MILNDEKKEKLITLFEDIKSWMLDNDYECGDKGSTIYNEINEILYDIDPTYKD